MPITSLQGNKYMALYIDDRSNWTHVEFIRSKSDQVGVLEGLISKLERQFGAATKTLRTDGGGEYDNKEMKQFLQERGIRWEHSAPRTPQQNGKSERMNRTIIEMDRCFLIDSGLPKAYWEYAVKMAAYLRNRTPTTANLRNETPYEVVFGKAQNLQNLPIFGSPLEVHIPDEMRDKSSEKSRTCIFLGVVNGAKAFVYEDVMTGRRFISRDGDRQQMRSPGPKGTRYNLE